MSDTCYIGNIFGVISAGATGVVVNSTGKLGTIVSSRRYEDDIKPMDQASEALFALQPVSFQKRRLTRRASLSLGSWRRMWKRSILTWWFATLRAK